MTIIEHPPVSDIRPDLERPATLAGRREKRQNRRNINAWFEPFGYGRGIQDPKTGSFLTPEDAVRDGYILAGTVDTVIRGVEANMRRQPVDWTFCYTYNGLIPHAKLMTSIEAYATKVMPRFA